MFSVFLNLFKPFTNMNFQNTFWTGVFWYTWVYEFFLKYWEKFSSTGSATAARISAVRQPFSPWGYHAGCHCSNKTVVLPPSSSSSSTKRFGFDRKRMLLPSRMSNEKPQRRTTAESRSQTAMSFASEPCW